MGLQLHSSILLLILLIVFPVLLIAKSRRKSCLKLPPGPTQLPILGHLHLIDRSLPHRSLWLLSKAHGPIMQLQLGLKPAVVVSTARMVGEVFKSHDHIFSQRPALFSNKTLTYNFSDLALSPHNGEYWKEMRRLLFQELLNAKTVQSFRSIREAEVDRMISTIRSSPPSHPIDLKEILITLTNNVVCTAAFGRSYLEGSAQEKAKLLGMIAEGIYLLSRFFVEDFLPWMWWIDVASGLYAKLEKLFGELDEFYERVIEEHLHTQRQKEEHEDFLDILLRDHKDSRLSRDHTKGVMMNILFGATDTTAAALAWGMVELMRNQQAMKKCQEEVRRIIGTKKGKVDEDDLPQLEYLKAMVKESFRLRPPVPLSIPRECTRQCKIDGYDVLPATILIVNTWAIGRDPEAWDKPHEFLPERFLNSCPIHYKGQDFELLPFGTGRRGCPGIHFSAATIELALANLLYHFDWELPPAVAVMGMDESSGVVTLPKSIILVPTNQK
ncbi:hypothetical protein ACLOJK_009249 [Asimina triloba]